MDIKHNGKMYNVGLYDNGTLDTCVRVNGKLYTYSSEVAEPYRNTNGAFDDNGFNRFVTEVVISDISNDEVI